MTDFAIYLLTGEFGLLTLTPIFVFTILLPAITIFNLLSQILKETGIMSPLLLIFIMGLGCTTAALASLSCNNKKQKFIAYIILCLIVPCSAQVAVIISLLFLLDFPYVIFYFAIISLVLSLLYSISKIFCPLVLIVPPQNKVFPNIRNLFHSIIKSLKPALLDALIFIKESLPSFMVGSAIVSLLSWNGFFAWLCKLLAPFTSDFLRLPKEASSLFVLSILKRDLGAASLLSIIQRGSFTMEQITICMIILTLFVPCFASTVVLLKKEGPFTALLIWIICLVIAFLAGKLAGILLL